jgi:hypothetical protein
MSCWCGHGPWHHYGYAYPPPTYAPPGYPPSAYPPAAYPAPPRPRRRRRARIADLETLADLGDELARVREELAEYRREEPQQDQAG